MEDLALARIHCDGMRELIANNPAHWKDEQALDLIRSLCTRAREVITDRASQTYLSAIDDYAAAVGSNMYGPGSLRREILRELRLLSVRLAELEADRRLAGADAPPAGARRRERYAAVLREAAQSVGGTPRLAALLEVPLEDLERWTTGTEAAPLRAFLAALDVVAGGWFARQPHRVRVAVLRAERQAAVAAVLSVAASIESEMPSWLRAPFGYVAPAMALLFAAALAYYLTHSTLPDTVPEAARNPAPLVQPEVAEPPKMAVSRAPVRKVTRAKRAAAPPKVAPAAQLFAAAEPLVEDACASATGFSWLLCQEGARREYCDGREGLEPGCPSVIPASLPY
jgi:hypothetical protein